MAHFGGSWCIFWILRLIFSPRRWFQGGHFHRDKSPKRGFESRFQEGQFTTTWNPHSHPKSWWKVRKFGPPKNGRNTPVKALFFELPRYKLRYMNYKKVAHRNFQTVYSLFFCFAAFLKYEDRISWRMNSGISYVKGRPQKFQFGNPKKSKMLRISHPQHWKTQNRGGKPIFVHPKKMPCPNPRSNGGNSPSKVGLWWRFHLGPLWGS